MAELSIVQADLDDARHQAAILELTRAYARDPMGNGRDLPEEVQRHLVPRLRAYPTSLVFHVALELYGRFGFAPGQFDPAAGAVLFRVKPL